MDVGCEDRNPSDCRELRGGGGGATVGATAGPAAATRIPAEISPVPPPTLPTIGRSNLISIGTSNSELSDGRRRGSDSGSG